MLFIFIYLISFKLDTLHITVNLYENNNHDILFISFNIKKK